MKGGMCVPPVGDPPHDWDRRGYGRGYGRDHWRGPRGYGYGYGYAPGPAYVRPGLGFSLVI
jgi:hypothetical protein